MISRRDMLKSGAALLLGGAAPDALSAALAARTQGPLPGPKGSRYNPVVTLNGSTLPWRMERGVKVFHLIAEPVQREFAPGMVVNCWGYNGQTPGPTIEAVEGDRVRILVTNKLPEHTTVHWHGIHLPNGMDGVGGLTQPSIPPGETFFYEFTLPRSGSFMYHPHADEMVQMALGMMGSFVVHPKRPEGPAIDRDYCIMLAEWAVEPGTMAPNPMVMTAFNTFSFNSRVFPGIDSMVARTGERVRIRLGNLSMDSHPIHLHGHTFYLVGTDGGWIPPSAQWPMTTVNVPPGTVQVIDFVAERPGDWAFHCHKSHHTMGPMGHSVPNMIGVRQGEALVQKINKLLPDYMVMGGKGMADMQQMSEMGMALPENTLPMMTGQGPFGPMEMGGMFTVVKIRDDMAPGDYRDPGWYQHPKGTVSGPVQEEKT